MADKELTVFVVDLAATKRLFDYLFHVLAGKLIKGLKTDLVSVMLFHSPTTVHALASSGKFKGIQVLMEFEQVSYIQLKQLYDMLVVENIKPDLSLEASDFVQSTLFSTTLLSPTKGKVFTRNTVLIADTDVAINSDSASKIESFSKFFQGMSVNMVIVASGLRCDNTEALQLMKSQFQEFLLISDLEAEEIIVNCPPYRKTRPMSVFKGDLRLGSDFAKVLQDPCYTTEKDPSCIAFKVDVYPACKVETNSLGTHEYIVDDGTIVKLDRKTRHFVWNANFQNRADEATGDVEENDKLFDKVFIEPSLFTPGFKFSNFDLIALDNDLKEAATLKIKSSFDILAFIDLDTIPIAFLTGEALFILPEKDSTLRNILNHNAFCVSLLEERKALLARFVRKTEKEVEVGVLFPNLIKTPKDTENAQNAQDYRAHVLIFIRLPFKEDIKVGNFIKLSIKDFPPEKEKESVDFGTVNELMEDFINAKTLPEEELKLTDQQVIENFKVTMKNSESSRLPLPQTKVNSKGFVASDPGPNKFNLNCRKLLIQSLSYDDSLKFYAESESEAKILFDSNSTNHFNLGNALAVNGSLETSEALIGLAAKANDVSKKLTRKLGSAYVRKADLKKRKKITEQGFESKGNYGAEETNYDKVPEFDF